MESMCASTGEYPSPPQSWLLLIFYCLWQPGTWWAERRHFLGKEPLQHSIFSTCCCSIFNALHPSCPRKEFKLKNKQTKKLSFLFKPCLLRWGLFHETNSRIAEDVEKSKREHALALNHPSIALYSLTTQRQTYCIFKNVWIVHKNPSLGNYFVQNTDLFSDSETS